MVSLGELYDDLTHPAGDPAGWRAAARAWRQLAADLAGIGDDLEAAIHPLREPAWTGPSQEAFTGYWVKELRPLFGDEQVARYVSVADQLERTAQKIEEYNQLAQALALAIAACAVVTVATAGIGTAFGAGNAAVVAAEAGVAYTALQAFLGLLSAAFVTYVKFWAITFVFGLATNAVYVGIASADHNPFNGEHWSLRGLAQQIHGATTVGILGATGVAAPVMALAGKHQLAWNLGRGAVSGGVPAAYNLLSLEHRKLSDVWWQIAASTGVWSLWTAALGRMFRPPPSSALRPIARRDALVQGSMLGFVPGTAMRGVVPLAKATPAPAELPPPAVDDVKAPPQSVPFTPPQTIGGGTYTVRPDDSLWTIAADRLGDPLLWTKIAAANPGLANPSLINPGQHIHLPTLRVGADCL